MSLLYAYVLVVWLCIMGAAFFMDMRWLQVIELSTGTISNICVGAAAVFGICKYSEWKEEFILRERHKAAVELKNAYSQLVELIIEPMFNGPLDSEFYISFVRVRNAVENLKNAHEKYQDIISYDNNLVEKIIKDGVFILRQERNHESLTVDNLRSWIIGCASADDIKSFRDNLKKYIISISAC